MATIIANDYGFKAERQYKLKGKIDQNTENYINKIHAELREGTRDPDTIETTKQIKQMVEESEHYEKDRDRTVDLYLKKFKKEYLFDITTVKPNISKFSALKRKLLRWRGLRISCDKSIKIYSRLAIPYNPYHPKPYARWTLKGLYDLDNREIMIGKDFWNFLANKDIYQNLLDVVEEVGDELNPQIEKFFKRFK